MDAERTKRAAAANQTGNARVPYDCAACTSLPPLSIALRHRDHLHRSSVFATKCIADPSSINRSVLLSFLFLFPQCFFQVRSRAFYLERVVRSPLLHPAGSFEFLDPERERERGLDVTERKKRSSTILLPSDNFRRPSIILVIPVCRRDKRNNNNNRKMRAALTSYR